MKALTVRVEDELFKAFKIALAKRSETAQTALHRAVVEYVKETDKGKNK